ncbi:hypothetical protein K9M50_03125 [Patescibacteria group bacterium]|nr:hypothetical protein [Patescibacteria group bacterium]
MRNLIVLLLLIILSSCSTQTILEDENGNHYLFSSKEIKENKLNIVGDAKYYSPFFSKAIDRAGRLILIKEKEEFKKLKPLFVKVIDVKSLSILYNKETNTIKTVRKVLVKEETSYLILFVFLSIISMILSKIFRYKKTKVILSASSFICIFLYIVFSSIALFSNKISGALILFVLLGAYFVFINTLNGKRKKRKWYYVIYYITIIAYISLLYI